MNNFKKISIALSLISSFSFAEQYNALIGNNSKFTVEDAIIAPPVLSENNLILIGTNGITAGSFTASSTYSADHVSGIADGFGYYDSIVPGKGAKIARGIWVSDGSPANEWISIDLGKITTFSRARLITEVSSVWFPYLPKELSIQTSIDGITFNNVKSFVGEEKQINDFDLDESLSTRYVRFFFSNNLGGVDIQISEIELY